MFPKTSKGILLFTAIVLATGNSCHKVPEPPSPDDTGLFAACVIPGSSVTLDIVTFNVEGFPRAGYASVTALSALIKTIDPDVVALQEVASETDLNRMIKLMPGWTGVFYPINNDEWNLAYLFKNSETEVIESSERLLFEDDTWAFPRPPFEVKIRHKASGEEIFLINLHLKCCSGTDNENRRRSAFADMTIAKGSELWWSYPSWPSHIDHILITDELVPHVDTTMVVKASPCYPDYNDVLSDHRPVMIRITL
jgi:endonuclease/exonuclease/phosphatase family metal-dependent hydrolase